MFFTQLGNKLHIPYLQASFFASLFFLSTLFSCSSNSDTILASVNDATLTYEDATVLMNYQGLNSNDSTEIKQFAEEWCERQLYIEEINQRFPEEQQLLELRAKSFQSDLARYIVEEDYLLNQIDTTVTAEQIAHYFNHHKDEFTLQDYIVKALYLKIPSSIDFKEDDVQILYLLKNDKDLSQLNSYAKLYAEDFYFDDSTWIFFNELSKDIPLKKFNVDNIVLNRSKTYFSDDEFTYFLNIIDFKLKDEIPPIEFLDGTIREIILQGRIQDLRTKKESLLIQTLKDKHEVNIHL